jgi:hypothetical protein
MYTMNVDTCIVTNNEYTALYQSCSLSLADVAAKTATNTCVNKQYSYTCDTALIIIMHAPATCNSSKGLTQACTQSGSICMHMHYKFSGDSHGKNYHKANFLLVRGGTVQFSAGYTM